MPTSRRAALERIFLFLACLSILASPGCDRKKAPQGAPPPASADASEGPIRHETLTAEQLARIDKINQTFADVDGKTHEKLIDGFKREADVDRELGVWEQMAKSYQRYLDAHSPSPEAKKEVFKIVLMRSITSEDDVLDRLKLNILSKEDAIEVMRDH